MRPSSFPAFASASICASQTRASNSTNQARNFARLRRQVREGHGVLHSNRKRPVANGRQTLAAPGKTRRRPVGIDAGKGFSVPDDFDDPLPPELHHNHLRRPNGDFRRELNDVIFLYVDMERDGVHRLPQPNAG